MANEVGFKKPPKHSQFGQPDGNPMGKTSKQKDREIKNAEKAVALRGRYLDALERQMNAAQVIGDDEAMNMAISQMDQVTLKLIKDAEDRGLGAPVQPIISPDESMSPKDIDGTLVDALVKKLTD